MHVKCMLLAMVLKCVVAVFSFAQAYHFGMCEPEPCFAQDKAEHAHKTWSLP